MSVSARLPSEVVAVEPGSEAEILLQVRNTSAVVEAYQFEVVGVPGGWTTVEPETLSLYPGTDNTVAVRLRPPRSADVAAQQYPFGVRVIPTEHPDEAVVPEGAVDVAPYTATSAELTPRNNHGRWRARYEVAVDNRGNVPIEADLAGTDPDQQLTLTFRPAPLRVPPGQAQFTTVRVRTRRRRWRGQPATRPFQVLVRADGEEPIVLDGALLQQPILPTWTARALVWGLTAVVALAALWFALLKPTIESAAEEAVARPAAQAREDAAAAKDAAELASDSEKAATDAAGAAGDAAAKLDPNTTAGLVGSPTTERLTAAAGAGSRATDNLSVRNGRRLEVTDLVLQNPQGDSGTITLRRGREVLLQSSLANFRDLDYHFVSPILVDAGQSLTLEVACQRPGSGQRCQVAVLVGGTSRDLRR